jgi:hypothetical protein
MRTFDINGVDYTYADRRIEDAVAGDWCFADKESSGEDEDKIFQVRENNPDWESFNILGEDNMRYSYSYSVILQPVNLD